jgi:hypothetical protein
MGAVAQLGERRVRNAKVEGSIPFRSTKFFPSILSAVRASTLTAFSFPLAFAIFLAYARRDNARSRMISVYFMFGRSARIPFPELPKMDMLNDK